MMCLVTNRARVSIIPITCYMQQNQEPIMAVVTITPTTKRQVTEDSMTAVMAMSMTSRLLIALVMGINMVVDV